MSASWSIGRISLTTAQPEALAAFYGAALGFSRVGTSAFGGDDVARVMGLPSARGEATLLALGGQFVELLAFAEKGRPYPAGSTSADLIFQHMAIVVRDMREAYARLSLHAGWTPISTAGPQRLPEEAGGVTAFKFRDPEGHPLELLEFPPSTTPQAWRGPHGPEPCLGVDHSAISVSDTAASAAFYAGLGFGILGRSFNTGLAQQRLDGLADAEVEVTALGQADAVPHLEFLCYRSTPPRRAAGLALAGNDVAATRLVLVPRRDPAHPVGAHAWDWRAMRASHDPDGHQLLILDP